MGVELEQLEPGQVVDSSEYLAQLRPLTATALQPQIDGHVTAILVRPGQPVEQGQLLMQIDPGPQPAAVNRARANRAGQEANLRLAEINVARVRALVEGGASPRQDLDNAEAALETARKQVEALGADITGSRAQLQYYRITAPGKGVVGDIPVRVGDLVTSQTRLTSVTDNSVLEANVSLPSERSADVKLGTPVQLVDDSSQLLAAGNVGFISPQVNSETQSVLVKANIDNRDGRLRAEQIVRARVVWRTHEGLTIPALAVTRLGGQTFVYVATAADGGLVARQRPVTLGELTNNRFVVQKGLEPGDRIVVSNVQKLRDGAPIQQVQPKAPAPPSAPASPEPRAQGTR